MQYSCLIPYALNVLDLALTLHALAGGGVELNPLMQCVPVMVLYKIGVMAIILKWLSNRPERAARYALAGAVGLYGAVDIYHIINILSVR